MTESPLTMPTEFTAMVRECPQLSQNFSPKGLPIYLLPSPAEDAIQPSGLPFCSFVLASSESPARWT